MTMTFASVTYANGSTPDSILAPLDGQPLTRLRRDAAAAWNAARADAHAETGIVLSVRGWTRTLAEQERFFFERYERRREGDGPFNDVRWYTDRYVRVRGASAAVPGRSNHGWGLAVDVNDFGVEGQFDHPRRVRTFPILARHGWTDTEGRGVIQEPWHLVFDPSIPSAHALLSLEEDMPLNNDDLSNIEDRTRGVVREQLLQILRAPEFGLTEQERRRQTAEAVLGGTVSDRRTYGTQPLSLVLGDIFVHARAGAAAEVLAQAIVAALPASGPVDEATVRSVVADVLVNASIPLDGSPEDDL